MREISQTLSGRCGVLFLMPLSLAELDGRVRSVPGTPSDLFANRRRARELWPTVFTGFYPRIHDRGIPPEV